MLRCISSKSTSLFISFTSDRQWVHLNLNLHWIFFFFVVHRRTNRSACCRCCVRACTCGILKGMWGLWKPTARKNGRLWSTWFFSSLTASSVLSRSGRVPPGCSVTFTAHSKLMWSFPSPPLHIWKKNYRKTLSLLTTTLIFFKWFFEQITRWLEPAQWSRNTLKIKIIKKGFKCALVETYFIQFYLFGVKLWQMRMHC